MVRELGDFNTNGGGSVSGVNGKSAVTICFGRHFAHSDKFDKVFDQGMALVERAAQYLDGEGRKDAKSLKPPVSIAYATESMRLTTRLLDLASWLLIQRSLKDGEISQDDALDKRQSINLRSFGCASHVRYYDQLPLGLQKLIKQSYALNDRIRQLDAALQSEASAMQSISTPVNDQHRLLETQFSRDLEREPSGSIMN